MKGISSLLGMLMVAVITIAMTLRITYTLRVCYSNLLLSEDPFPMLLGSMNAGCWATHY